MIRNKPRDAAVFGVDIGKKVFHVVGADTSGEIVQRAKFRREIVLAFFQRANPTLVGMEACTGARGWLARCTLSRADRDRRVYTTLPRHHHGAASAIR